ncbi:MAG TPA: hypothetical protein VNE00_06665 [Paraburkholderia sp.]|jgi:hypothetical protein|nr:hypothetical protein [Paraburkholderia sp.]
MDALNLALAILLALIVCLTHREIPRFTAARANAAIAHLLLIAVGCAVGLVYSRWPDAPAPHWAAFATGFGVVHVPAFAILVIKRMRGSRPS